MSPSDVRFNFLKQVVADRDPIFWTKDVSKDERMEKAHLGFVEDRNYHAAVGSALSAYSAALGIVKAPEGEDKG